MKSVKILLAALGLFLTLNIQAQAPRHVVQQGETVYAIARKYGVSPNEVLKLNPSLGNGDKIRPGQTLTLPANAKTGNATPADHPTATRTMDQNGSTTGNANNATQQNAPVTYTIDLPQRNNGQQVVSTPQTPSQGGYLNSGCKEMYKIQKKDNLYRIALNYNLTIEELCEANPGLTPDTKLKKGEFLCIPYSRAERQAEADRLAAEKAAEEAARASKQNAYKKHINVAVILPLKEGGDRGNKMIEFYRGLLMAADSIKHQGTSIDIYAFHSGTTASDIKYVTSKPELKNMDLIFGPLDAQQASTLSDFCMQNKIRLVMPFSTTNTFGQNNPYVYQASISSENARRNAVDMVTATFTNCNYVILNTGSTDDRGARFISELRSVLTARGQKANTLNIDGDESAYINALNQFRDNMIIADASSLTATTALAKKLRAFKDSHPEYKISLVGYPEWPTYVNTLLFDFYALDTYAYCTFYRNPTEGRVVAFEAEFKRHFKKDISRTFPRFGIFGFDLGYYFMNGLSKLGTYFEEKQSSLEYRPFQNPFLFDQKTSYNAHINHQVYLVHYMPSQRIEIIK